MQRTRYEITKIITLKHDHRHKNYRELFVL
jgi:hypothetical protein